MTLGGIQRASVRDGAIFGIAHPTSFPTALFASFCRGCEFTLGEEIDWGAVDTMEVVTGPALVDDTQLGGPGLGVQVQNPFVLTAIDQWQRLLLAGHRVAAVSGSDDELGPLLGSSATAVHAEALSRPALIGAVRAGHAYVRTLGVDGSPELEMTAVSADGQRGIFGDTLRAAAATVTVQVRGGAGQLLSVTRDGLPDAVVPVPTDDFTHTFTATRSATSGPLGTFWRVDTLALTNGSSSPYLTTIGNPIFLAPGARAPQPAAPPEPPGPPPPSPRPESGRLPATGAGAPLAMAVLLGGAALVVRRLTEA